MPRTVGRDTEQRRPRRTTVCDNLTVPKEGPWIMDVRALPPRNRGLLLYRITVPERPGSYAVLEVPDDTDDPVGLVELFAGTHLHLLQWADVEEMDEAADAEPPTAVAPSDYSADMSPHQRHRAPTG